MTARLFIFDPDNPRREEVLHNLCKHVTDGNARVHIKVCEPTRTLEQNDRMWAMLTDVAKQVEWPVDGRTQKLEPEEWKHILTAGLRKEQRVAQGIGGGFVILGQRTSKMTKRELSDLMEVIAAFGAERGVIWGDDRPYNGSES